MDQLSILAHKKSIELLHLNSAPFGFRAAHSNDQKPEYAYLFGRDGSICALCCLDEDEPGLKQQAQKTLESLRDNRSDLGQVPCRINPGTNYKDFWFPGNLDSTLWWALASLKLVQHSSSLKTHWQRDIEHSLTWLRYQDTAEIGLLTQGQGADWADEMPNHGAVLYSNALWYKVVCEYIQTYGTSALIDNAYQQQLKQSFNYVFWPYQDHQVTTANRALARSLEWVSSDLIKQPYYISYMSRRAYGRRCDIFGNILALMFGLADEHQQISIEKYLLSIHVATPYPGRSLYPVIYPGEAEWQDGMATRAQDVPHQYHNGGIWPFIGGFWVTYVATHHSSALMPAEPDQELHKLAQANQLNDWQFNEYLHGQFGTPMGIAKQSWNAATYLLAYKAVAQGKSLLSLPDTHKPGPKPKHNLPLPSKINSRFFTQK